MNTELNSVSLNPSKSCFVACGGSSPTLVHSTHEQHSEGNLICAISPWELMAGVALRLSKRSPWSSAKRKGDRLPRCTADTDTKPLRPTYLLTYYVCVPMIKDYYHAKFQLLAFFNPNGTTGWSGFYHTVSILSITLVVLMIS